jgi:hypothetical protein
VCGVYVCVVCVWCVYVCGVCVWRVCVCMVCMCVVCVCGVYVCVWCVCVVCVCVVCVCVVCVCVVCMCVVCMCVCGVCVCGMCGVWYVWCVWRDGVHVCLSWRCYCSTWHLCVSLNFSPFFSYLIIILSLPLFLLLLFSLASSLPSTVGVPKSCVEHI